MYTHMHAWRGRVGAAAWRRCVVRARGAAACSACSWRRCVLGQLAGVCTSVPSGRYGGMAGGNAALRAIDGKEAGRASRRSRWARRWSEGLRAEPMRAREGDRNLGRGRRASVEKAGWVRAGVQVVHSVRACRRRARARVWRGRSMREAVRGCERLVRATGAWIWMRFDGRRSP